MGHTSKYTCRVNKKKRSTDDGTILFKIFVFRSVMFYLYLKCSCTYHQAYWRRVIKPTWPITPSMPVRNAANKEAERHTPYPACFHTLRR